ncbi:MAG: hypothetical protein WCI04_01390, partial [archaeon]
VVDIVVGTIGQPADVIWAGNIAAKVAQMAVVPASGSTDKTVDITVGGNSNVSGNGETAESKADFSNQEATFASITTTSTQMPSLVNNPSAKYRWNSTTDSTTSISEDLSATVDAKYQGTQGSSYFGVGQLYGSIARDGLAYNVRLGVGLDLTTSRLNLDGNSYFKMQIPWLGKIYSLDQIDATNKSLVFYSDTTPTVLGKDESITVQAADGNKTYSLVLKNVTKTGANNDYKAAFALMDGATQVGFKDNISSNTDLKDEFSVKLDSAYITSVSTSADGSALYVAVRTGTDRLELRHNKGYPYTGDTVVDNKQPWEVIFDNTSTVTVISLKNRWSYDQTSSESTNSKHVLLAGGAVTLPNDFAQVKLAGFQNKVTTDAMIGQVSGLDNTGGGIAYTDLKGSEIKLPFSVTDQMDLNEVSVVTIQGKDYTFWLDGNGSGAYDLYYKYGNYGDITSTPTTATVTPSVNEWVVVQDVMQSNTAGVARTPATVSLDLGARTATNAIDYITYGFMYSHTTKKVALLLAPQDFSIYNKAKAAVPKISFVDTNVAGTQRLFYVPNTEEVLTSAFDSNWGAKNSDNRNAAKLTYTDNNSGVTTMYVRADSDGTVWDAESLKNESSTIKIYGLSMDATYAPYWSSAIRDGTDYFKDAFTLDGTEVKSDGSMFTLTVPEEQKNVEVYLGGTGTSTVTTGGASYPGVKVGETKGNVTVTAISGATSGSTIVPVSSNFVVADTASASGKSILVGGWLANTKVAAELVLPNNVKLNEALQASGDYVSAVLTDGSILVAGWTASDTASAARALITALDGLQ